VTSMTWSPDFNGKKEAGSLNKPAAMVIG